MSSPEEEGKELAMSVTTFWEVLASARSSQVQEWTPGDYKNAYLWAQQIETIYAGAKEETKENMRKAMHILSGEGTDPKHHDECTSKRYVEEACASLLVTLIENSFLTKEVLSLALVDAEMKRFSADCQCLQSVVDALSSRICLQSVEMICREAITNRSFHQQSQECARKACERVMRRRWRNAMRLGEEQAEDFKRIIGEYLHLYPREYSDLLIGMLSKSSSECLRDSSDNFQRSLGLIAHSKSQIERENYRISVTNISIVRLFEELLHENNGFLWERATPMIVVEACQQDEHFLKYFLSSSTDLLTAFPSDSSREERCILILRRLSDTALDSLSRQAARELLALVT